MDCCRWLPIWWPQSIQIMNNSPSAVISILFLVAAIASQQTKLLEFDQCRLTTDKYYNLVKCEVKGDCANGRESSDQSCETFLYVEITADDCKNKCCPKHDIYTQVIECYDRGKRIEVLRIVIIVGAVVGLALLMILAAATVIFGFQRNPYTGENIWVGFWCCKRKYNFKPQRQKAVGPDCPPTQRPALPPDDINTVNPEARNNIMADSLVVKPPIKL